jgi:hypothetical protein
VRGELAKFEFLAFELDPPASVHLVQGSAGVRDVCSLRGSLPSSIRDSLGRKCPQNRALLTPSTIISEVVPEQATEAAYLQVFQAL